MPKYQALLDVIREDFGWRPDDPTDRIVVFTERIPTLNWLKPHLAHDLGLTDLGRIAVLHGGLSDTEQQRVVEDFGNSQRAVRLLLCSDIASEGINLHHQCHRLIHFDLPWSLMVFAQRNGRIDRYGQAAYAPHRLPSYGQLEHHYPRRHSSPGGAEGEGRAGVPEHR